MNFRHILSKSSLQSSSSSGIKKSNTDEIMKLQSEIELLKQTVESLKISVESRDAAIGTLAREKEKLYGQLKSAQRSNRNFHQQLVDERDIHSKEKDYLIEEIKRLSNKDSYESYALKTRDSEEQSNYSFQEEAKAKDEVIFNVCSKYLKIMSSKLVLKKKIENMQVQSQKTCEDIVLLLQENRNTLNNLLSKLMKTASVSPNSKKYLKLLKINANLHFENTTLKVIYISSQNKMPNNYGKQPSEDCWQVELGAIAKYSKFHLNRYKSPYNEGQYNSAKASSKLSNVLSIGDYEDLKYIYKSFESHFRDTLCRSHSDPCILSISM